MNSKKVDPTQTYVLEETAITKSTSLEALAEHALRQTTHREVHPLEQLLERIKATADAHAMDAFLDSSRARQQDGSWSQKKILKISPKGVRSRLLLQVEFEANRLKLYSGPYQGRPITEAWIREFIKHNHARARTMMART